GSNEQDVNGLTAGFYNVVVTDQNGCYVETEIELLEPLAVVMSNSFSPNGDGANDYFFIKNIERYPENKLMVMNRWGSVVYQAESYNNEWDGTSNSNLVLYGSELPEGSYYYVLILYEGAEPIKGYIVLKR